MRKIVSLIILSLILFSCSKVKKGEFLITGTAKGIENGKMVVLQTLNNVGMMMPMDTVKVKDGKFEFKGKINEPKIYTIIFPELNNGFSIIVENDESKVEVYKDSIQSSKIYGTYNNDEFHKFNLNMKKLNKELTKKQETKMKGLRAQYEQAMAKNDSVTIGKLMAEATKVQEEQQKVFSNEMESYTKDHPKSFISLLIVESMIKNPTADFKKIKSLFESLDDDLKVTTNGKSIKMQLDAFSTPKKNSSPQVK